MQFKKEDEVAHYSQIMEDAERMSEEVFNGMLEGREAKEEFLKKGSTVCMRSGEGKVPVGNVVINPRGLQNVIIGEDEDV